MRVGEQATRTHDRERRKVPRDAGHQPPVGDSANQEPAEEGERKQDPAWVIGQHIGAPDGKGNAEGCNEVQTQEGADNRNSSSIYSIVHLSIALYLHCRHRKENDHARSSAEVGQ